MCAYLRGKAAGKQNFGYVKCTTKNDKQKKINKKNALFSNQEAKINMTNDKMSDNEILKQTLIPETNVVDRVKMVAYNIKGKYYEKELSHQQQIFSIMKEKSIGFKGANVINIKKKVTQNMRKGFGKVVSKMAEYTNQLNEMINEQPIATNTASKTI